MSEHTPDILIIGAGASGAAVAWSLAEAGFDVLCLEQGPQMKPADYPPAKPDWEMRQLSDFHFEPNVRRLDYDYPVDDTESAIAPLMFNAVGGSTIHWTAHAPRFHPSDFRVRTLDGAAHDWPISYEDLKPWYDLNDNMMGCSGIAGDPANPPRTDRPMPPLSLGRDGERLAGGFDKLGWHWWPSDSYINSVERDGRQACNNCGPNGLGCTLGAKASSDVTYWPKALKLGAKLKACSRVSRIIAAEDGRVTAAEYFDEYGKVHRQPARAVVVACNGIGTPRLLLMSQSPAHPNGLANSSGLVGKNLMFHPYAMTTGMFRREDSIRTWQGPLGNMLMSQQFYETDERRGFIRGYTHQAVRSSGPVWTALGGFVSSVPWGESHHLEFARRFGNTTTLAVISEDLPEEHNRVELSSSLQDSSGLPAPKIFYKVSRNTRRILNHGMNTAEHALMAAGAYEIFHLPLLRSAGWHLMGTARMGDSSTESVVDKWGQAHDADNLFIVDGSIFVTSGAVNPTPTIQALALRTAHYIRSQRKDLKR